MKIQNITVIGSGYVGTTTAAFLANAGFNVVALDIDKKKVKIINSGKSPFFEAGLDELIAAGIKKKTLVATTNYGDALHQADVVISCVGTPDNPDGSSNLKYVFAAAESSKPYLKSGAIYVQKSTVPVGTGRKVIPLLSRDTHYVSNPEFLREGTAVYDTLLFDRIVVGGDNKEALETVLSVYKNIANNAVEISSITGGIAGNKAANHKGNYIDTTLESAELIKVTANAFLALKISFANSIAKLCDEANADAKGVMDGIGADKRIGRAFLNAGRGYGGGCFPKDVSGLISSSLEFGVEMPIMHAATEVNESMAGYIVEKVKKQLGGLSDKRVTTLGLAFKSGTSDARKSPAVKIANYLQSEGGKISAYDPEANHEAQEDLHKEIVICDDAETAVKDAEIIFITTDWPEFTDLSWLDVAKNVRTVVDCMNCLNRDIIEDKDITYIGVGR